MEHLFDDIYDEPSLEGEECTIHGESSCPQCMAGDFKYPSPTDGYDPWRNYQNYDGA